MRKYLDAPDDAFRWRKLRTFDRTEEYTVDSQQWQGLIWQHRLWWVDCLAPLAHDTAWLIITGDLAAERDLAFCSALQEASSLPVATLFDIPNQPLFDELREDDLIAFTFERFIRSEEGDWPLLFPMVRAAIRTMDAIQEIKPHIQRFLVTGASKRGWTTWLVGGVRDPRVIGIVPTVYDNLNLLAQMRAQREVFGGGFSPMLDDYTRRSLQALGETPIGQELCRAVDPYTFLEAMAGLPKLPIHGTNDPFWLVDSMRQYWHEVPGPKSACVVPNAGHDLGDGTWQFRAFGAFTQSVLGGHDLPEVHLLHHDDELISSCDQGAPQFRLWRAVCESLDFSSAIWSIAAEGPNPFQIPEQRVHQAFMAEADFGSHSLTSAPIVVRAGT